MKKYIFNPATIAFFIVSMLLSQVSAAHVTNEDPSFIKTAVIQPLTADGNNSVFQLKLSNKNAEKFTVIVRDNAGTTLFQETYQDKAFEKKFLFENLNEQGTLTIIVRAAKNNATQTFEVNAVTRVVQDVVVNKL